MRARTRARELALQFLFTLDLRGDEARDELELFLTDSGASREVKAFVTERVDGVREHKAVLDAKIRELTQNWSLERIARVDRNVLRLAAYEILHCPDVPVRVALNEAIELGKRYSTEKSGSFINGILDKLKDQAVARDSKP